MKRINIISYLFRRILLIRMQLGNDGTTRTELATVRFAKGKACVGEWKDMEADALAKWKHTPAILWITGEQIVSKPYDKDDVTQKRIMNNPELLWTIDSSDEQGQVLSFLRRDTLAELLQTIDRQHLPLVDTWLCSSHQTEEMQIRLEQMHREQFRTSALLQSPDHKNILADILYRKLFLPVLLFFFALLLGNFFLNSYYTKEYQQKQNIIQQDRKANRMNAAGEQKKNQLLDGYNRIANLSFALLADRVASYVPANMYLTSLKVGPPLIRLKGTVGTPGSVTLLSQLLEADNLFAKVKVVQLGRKKNSELFEFEMEITL